MGDLGDRRVRQDGPEAGECIERDRHRLPITGEDRQPPQPIGVDEIEHQPPARAESSDLGGSFDQTGLGFETCLLSDGT